MYGLCFAIFWWDISHTFASLKVKFNMVYNCRHQLQTRVGKARRTNSVLPKAQICQANQLISRRNHVLAGSNHCGLARCLLLLQNFFFHWQCSKMGDTQIFRTFSGEPDCLSHKDVGCQNLAWAWLAIPGKANRTILKESKISMAVSSGTSVSLSCNIYIIIYIYTYAWYVYIYVAIYTYSTKWIQNSNLIHKHNEYIMIPIGERQFDNAWSTACLDAQW